MADRISLTSSLGDGVLLFHRLDGREAVGEPFELGLDLLSQRHDIADTDVLGKPMAVHLELDGKAKRHWHGFVSHFAYLGSASAPDGKESLARYEAVLAPWLWFLSRRQDCRIFQDKSVPDIVKEVASAYPGAELELRLTETYTPRVYCVQYRESDLAFVSRLLEDEGIAYFVEHAADKHTVVLVDAPNGYHRVPGYGEVPYYPRDPLARRERDHVDEWRLASAVRRGRTTLQSFDFEKPRTDLTATVAEPLPYARSASEVYDYPGDYLDLGRGDQLARLRLEADQAEHRRALGEATARGLAAGHKVKLKNHPRPDQNIDYLMLAVDHTLTNPEYRSADASGEPELYRCRFEAQDASVPFRPPSRTPRPVVRGPQTAMVTGPAGEEIWTDKYGRVKVQFHWDRLGKRDENSSCWIRVSQPWAGPGFGGMMLPRIGQEVVIDFLEGDPDRPIITGRVYNALAMPPYPLPANATQSGIKSNSSKGGGGSNEIRFEDKKGSEEVWIHAQKDENIVVENDKTELVKHNETITIGNDRKETVGHDETMAVVNNRTRNVGVNETVLIGANRADTVTLNEVRTVGVAQQQIVGAARNVTVGAAQAHEVGLSDGWAIGVNRSVEIGNDDSLDVGSDRKVSIGSNDSLDVGKNRKVDVGDNDSLQVGKDGTIQIGKNLGITAGDEITITVGKASIVMKKDGTISINGKDIAVEGSGKIDMKASGNITQKGQKILQN